MTSASECLSRHISIYLPEMYSRINFCTLLYLQNNKDKQNEISADMEKIGNQ